MWILPTRQETHVFFRSCWLHESVTQPTTRKFGTSHPLEKLAKERGFRPHESACSANHAVAACSCICSRVYILLLTVGRSFEISFRNRSPTQILQRLSSSMPNPEETHILKVAVLQYGCRLLVAGGERASISFRDRSSSQILRGLPSFEAKSGRKRIFSKLHPQG